MSIIELIFTAIALAMDCFAVSIVCGMVMKRVQLWPMFKIAFFFGLFQAMMPCIGWLCGTQFYHLISRVDHWLAFGILAFLGVKMIIDDLKPDCDEAEHINPYALKMILTMAVATSIDALAVGLSFSMVQVKLWQSVLIIGITSFVLSWIGMLLSVFLGKKLHLKAELIGGIILIIIGLRILIEHLCA